MERVRLDKWLWAARFYKTRALAAKACDMGRVECNQIVAKPAREIKTGDRLKIRIEGHEFELEVLVPAEMRAAPAVAQGFYRESEESRQKRERQAAERKALEAMDVWADPGRPSKKDRRDINRLRGR